MNEFEHLPSQLDQLVLLIWEGIGKDDVSELVEDIEDLILSVRDNDLNIQEEATESNSLTTVINLSHSCNHIEQSCEVQSYSNDANCVILYFFID